MRTSVRFYHKDAKTKGRKEKKCVFPAAARQGGVWLRDFVVEFSDTLQKKDKNFAFV